MGVSLLLVALLTLQRTSTAAVRGSPAIVGGGTLSSPPQTVSSEEITSALGSYDYDQVLELSLLFYEAQRSGHLPKDNRVPWRSDSCLKDRGQRGEDLEGGYYDGELLKQFSHLHFDPELLDNTISNNKFLQIIQIPLKFLWLENSATFGNNSIKIIYEPSMSSEYITI